MIDHYSNSKSVFSPLIGLMNAVGDVQLMNNKCREQTLIFAPHFRRHFSIKYVNRDISVNAFECEVTANDLDAPRGEYY